MHKLRQPSPPRRKAQTLKKTPAPETSKLEEKLDRLVTLLKSATQGMPGVVNAALFNSSTQGLVPASHGNTPGSTTGYQVSCGAIMPS
jgi:L-asparaginase/Glu-tRNA(Gln) amidotransferase subunit D